jgi:carboxymethylenebutenolidase
VSFGATARPPAPPRTGLLEGSEEVTLETDNGPGATATVATTASPHAPGLVLLAPPGTAYEAELARSFADAGIQAIAVAGDHVTAAVEELKRRGVSTVYVLGVGAGGRAALLHGSRAGVAGVVAIDVDPSGAALEAAREGRLTVPVLALYAGGDDHVDDETVEAFHAALAQAGTLQETVVYDGAPIGFFDGSRPELADACDDAWRRILRFVGVPAL